jgi:hypothetical protein
MADAPTPRLNLFFSRKVSRRKWEKEEEGSVHGSLREHVRDDVEADGGTADVDLFARGRKVSGVEKRGEESSEPGQAVLRGRRGG